MLQQVAGVHRPVKNVLEKSAPPCRRLRKSDAKVAKLILPDPFRILETSLAEVARLADVKYTPTTSRVAALVVIDILSTAVALRRENEHMGRLGDMKRRLNAFRSGDNKDVEDGSD